LRTYPLEFEIWSILRASYIICRFSSASTPMHAIIYFVSYIYTYSCFSNKTYLISR